MGISLGEAILDLIGDDTKLKADIEAAKSAATASLDKLSDGMTKTGKGLTAGVTAPLVALGAISLNSASDLDESMNKVQVVFEDSAGAVINFSETSAEKLGISQQAALEATGTFGNLFTAMGIGEQSSADMSVGLVSLASDIASFNNLDPTDVLNKFRAGLTGETEPLKALGINMNASAVEAKAMEMGLADSNGELSAAALAQARYAIILDQTQKAQGDFARTSDGLANSSRTVKAQLSDMAAQMGQFLLPIGLQVVTMLKDVLTWFTSLNPETQKTIVIILGVAAAMGPLLIVAGQLVGAIGAIIPVVTAVAGIFSGPVILAIAAIVAAVAALYLAWQSNFLGIQDSVAVVWSVIQSVFAAFKAAFEGDWTGFGENLRVAWDTAWGAIAGRFEAAKETLAGIASSIVEGIKKVFSGDVDWGKLGSDIVQGIASGITSAVDWVIKAVKGLGAAAIAAIKGFLGIKSPSKVFEEQVGWQIGAGIQVGIDRSMSLVEGAVSNLPGLSSNININSAGRMQSVMFNVPITVYGGQPDVVRQAANDGVIDAARRLGLK